MVSSLSYTNEKQAKAKSLTQIALLSKALEEYRQDMGFYPRTSDSSDGLNNSKLLYQSLFREGFDYTNQATPPATSTNKATLIYLAQLDPTSTKQGWMDPVATGTPPMTATIKDPWGIEYRYRSSENLTGTSKNTHTMNPDYDLWSSGKDGKSDGVSPAGNANRDDIRNF